MKNITDLQNAFSGKKKPKNQNQWLLDAVKKSKISKKPIKEFDTIYALYVIELDNSYFYIGRTSRDINTRLKEHLQESKKGKTKKCVVPLSLRCDRVFQPLQLSALRLVQKR